MKVPRLPYGPLALGIGGIALLHYHATHPATPAPPNETALVNPSGFAPYNPSLTPQQVIPGYSGGGDPATTLGGTTTTPPKTPPPIDPRHIVIDPHAPATKTPGTDPRHIVIDPHGPGGTGGGTPNPTPGGR